MFLNIFLKFFLFLILFIFKIFSIEFIIHKKSSSIIDIRNYRRYLQEQFPHAPVYRGYGTHFVYLWVGTPSHRISVIVDTGSHHTAFPCKGCNNCGIHTDKYWDPKQSSTSFIPLCGSSNTLCKFSQSYTEGSSWEAYKVTDIAWIGGEKIDMLDKLPKYSVNFTFGCQTSETGLFRTQVENGIMGLSNDPNTLPATLLSNKIISSSIFSLCLLPTGGVMSIGTINYNLNLHPIKYVQLITKSSYYTIHVENILLKLDREYYDIGESSSKINTGKGIIIDSGTTDSYLPSSISSSFRKVYQKITGIIPSNSPITLTQPQLHKLPTIIYRVTADKNSIESNKKSSHLRKNNIDNNVNNINNNNNNNSTSTTIVNENTIDIEFPPWNYMELQSNNRYIMRLYLTEGSGGVIGANMMVGHNIIFDVEKQRIGFSKSDCKITGQPIYDEVTKPKILNSK